MYREHTRVYVHDGMTLRVWSMEGYTFLLFRYLQHILEASAALVLQSSTTRRTDSGLQEMSFLLSGNCVNPLVCCPPPPPSPGLECRTASMPDHFDQAQHILVTADDRLLERPAVLLNNFKT